MPDRSAEIAATLFCFFLGWAQIAFHPVALAESGEDGSKRLQELLYGEALFHFQQKDYFSAITQLQLAAEQGKVPALSADTRILLARLKLAYGLNVDAAFDFHALLDENVPDSVRNRAWYELAKSFFQKGYIEAAEEALGHIRGEPPEDIGGDLQLLRASVLMALKRNEQAAQLLEQWKGAPESAGYAHYNRGIALMRAGDYEHAIESLEHVADLPAEDEEMLALRDKANLTLAYAFTQSAAFDRAQARLEKVRLQGPFSNRALLALGWIAHKQGRSEAALVPWTELRDRAPTDPAVLETLLIVPSVYRELESLQAATQDYETAVATYSDELRSLNDTVESVRHGKTVDLLLPKDTGSTAGGQAGHPPAKPQTRYFGRLLASRDFQQTLSDHGDLQSMLQDIDKGLQNIDKLAMVVEPGRAIRSPPTDLSPSKPDLPGPAAPATLDGDGRAKGEAHTSLSDDAEQQMEWLRQQAQPAEQPPGGIPPLPEIELPDDSAIALPQSEFSGLPESEFSGLPAAPEPTALLGGGEDIRLPMSHTVWLPESGRVRLPWNERDYAYPDAVALETSWAGPANKRQRMRLTSPQDVDAGFHAAAEPVGAALLELAAALSSATDRMARLSRAVDAAPPGVDGLDARVAALRARILALRGRISNAIVLNESYIEARALDELDRRQHQLKDLLEQASLELAKTYDEAADN